MFKEGVLSERCSVRDPISFLIPLPIRLGGFKGVKGVCIVPANRGQSQDTAAARRGQYNNTMHESV